MKLTGSNLPIHIIAKSYLLRPVDLRHAPSMGSSIVDEACSRHKGQSHWIPERRSRPRLDGAGLEEGGWLRTGERIGRSQGLDPDEGAKLLNFYLSGMATGEEVDDAVKAVDYYAKAFPGNIHGEELRWVLAERIRYLSQQGGPGEAALRHQAEQQYEQLEASKEDYAEKAHEASARYPSASGSSASGTHASAHARSQNCR